MSHQKPVMSPATPTAHRLFALPDDPDVEVLLGDPRPLVRRAGIDLARESMRRWRSAPALLTPLIVARLSADEAGVLGESLTASELAADRLADLLDVPGAYVDAAPALARIGDLRSLPALCRILTHPPRTWPYGLGEAVEAIAAPGAHLLLDALLSASARHPERCEPGRICPALLTAVGIAGFGAAATPAVPSLVALLRQAIGAPGHDHRVTGLARALGYIGPTAAAAVPLLESLHDEDAAVPALVRITGDRAYADAYLGALPDDPRRCPIGPELLGLLMDRGGPTGRQVDQLHRFFDRPGPAQVRTAPLIWRHDGPATAGRLLRVLPGYLDDHCCAPYALKTLVAMGAAARPVVPALEAIIDRRERLPVHLGDPGAELRADERLLTRTREARELIGS
jgi:hypothetical protein